MNNKERTRKILEQAKQALKIEDNIRLILYTMKYKVASISLKTKTIRINKNLINILDDKELYYIIVHELIHIKTTSLNHGKIFYKLLNMLYSPNELREIENRIVKKLLETSINTKKWLT